MRRIVFVAFVFLVLSMVVPAATAAPFFVDDWNDMTVQNPDFAPNGMNWQILPGSSVSANAASPPAGFYKPQSQVLMLSPTCCSGVSLNLPPNIESAPVEIRFKLRQTNSSTLNYLFRFGVKDTTSGNYYEEHASVNPAYYGSGFNTMVSTGSAPDDWTYGSGDPSASLAGNTNWNYIRFRFDPTNGVVIYVAQDSSQTKTYDDPTLIYSNVASWSNFRNLQNVNEFYLDNDNYVLSWMVYDVEVESPIFFRDDFNDLTVQTPAFTPSNANWVIESGAFSANASSPTPGFVSPVSQTLMFDKTQDSRISVIFGQSADSPVEARFKVRQTNGSSGNHSFTCGFVNTWYGYSYFEQGSTSPNYYGSSPNNSGFHSMAFTNWGQTGWTYGAGCAQNAALSTSSSNWNYIKFRFDPVAGVSVYQAIDTSQSKDYSDPSLVYTLVASWPNFWHLHSVDQFFLDNDNSQLSWMVDDVEIDRGGIIFSDNWDNQTVTTPPEADDWAVESGAFSADASNPTPEFVSPLSGTLMFDANQNSRIAVNFGDSVTGDPVEARFKVRQTNGSADDYCFRFGLEDSATGYSYLEEGSVNVDFYGAAPNNSGFHSMVDIDSTASGWTYGNGSAPGSALSSSGTNWNYIKFNFNPATGINVYQAIDPSENKTYNDPSLVYTLVASWPNFWSMQRVDTFFLDNDNYNLSWMVDDVEIEGLRWTQLSSAMQTIYQNGVPHTDKNGNLRTTYSSSSSFLPIGLYDFWAGTLANQTWSFTDLVNNRFNCCVLYQTQHPDPTIVSTAATAAGSGIQIIPQYIPSLNYATQIEPEIASIESSPAAIAWYLNQEPTSEDPNMQTEYNSYLTTKSEIKTLDPSHPVFILDDAWITPPVTQWWMTWNTSGDITCHDNYPISGYQHSLSSPIGLPESISLAVAANDETKPMWICTQAECWASTTNGLVMPTPAQETGLVYTALVHGATGILYFGMDSYVLRLGSCVGIAPSSKEMLDYGAGGTVATQAQLTASATLWNAVTGLNSQLGILKPSIFSPTATAPYEVYAESRQSETRNPIRTLLKVNPAGGYTLLLSNVDPTALMVRVRFPSNTTFTVSDMFNHSAVITRTADVFEFQAAGYDGRAFKLSGLTQSAGNLGSPVTIGAVKGVSSGTSVATSGIVSAAFTDYFYIESSDRSVGIRVNNAGTGFAVGQAVSVSGMVGVLASGESYIDLSSANLTGTGSILPLGLANHSLGGGPLGLQQGIAGASGSNNVGLLVKTTGRVTTSGSGWFKIDDGSGVGITVYGAVPTGAPYVMVTGISSCIGGGGSVEPAIIATSIGTISQ